MEKIEKISSRVDTGLLFVEKWSFFPQLDSLKHLVGRTISRTR